LIYLATSEACIWKQLSKVFPESQSTTSIMSEESIRLTSALMQLDDYILPVDFVLDLGRRFNFK
jgi:hypothetical protein